MEENQSLLDLQVDRDAANNLTEVSRWSKLFALIVIIGFGLLFILIFALWGRISTTLFAKDEVDAKNVQYLRIGMIFAFLVIGTIVGIMMSFLIKGGNRIRKGILNRDQIMFNSGLGSIKNYFVMYGVIALIGIFFSLLGLAIK